MIIGTLLPEILEPAIPMGVDENVILQEPHLSTETVLTEVQTFLDSDRDTHVHIIFSDFGGILPRDDSAPRMVQTLLRDCHRELEDRCAYFHHHRPSEMCWVTAFNYYANTSMFGPNLPPPDPGRQGGSPEQSQDGYLLSQAGPPSTSPAGDNSVHHNEHELPVLLGLPCSQGPAEGLAS